MTTGPGVDRRQFIGSGLLGAGLVGLGGVAGWFASRLGRGRNPVTAAPPAASAEPVYDLSRFQTVDPSLLLYEQAREFEAGYKRVRCVAASGDRILVGGDRAIRTFNAAGAPVHELALPQPPHCMDVGADGRLVVGLRDRVQAWSPAGDLILDGPSLGKRVFLTAVVDAGDRLYLADAGNREVIRADVSGAVMHRFGGGAPGDGPGFVVPSPYFDLALAPDGRLHVTNPGKHRVEIYTPDGELQSAWGRPGMAIEGFCGCCNPCHVALLPDGRYVTSEKGLDRIKIYGGEGQFAGVVAGGEQFGGDPVSAAKAADDCRLGCGFDVAVGSRQEVLVLNARTKRVQVFRPLAELAAHGA